MTTLAMPAAAHPEMEAQAARGRALSATKVYNILHTQRRGVTTEAN